MSEIKPKRSWLTFSLRTLLVLVTVVSVGLGLQVKRAREQREAVTAILQQQSTKREVAYDYQRVPDVGAAQRQGLSADILYYRFPEGELPEPRWLIDMAGVDFFHNVVCLSCFDNDVTDEVLEKISRLSNLEWLRIEASALAHLTNAGLVHLLKLKRLEFLELTGTQVDDDGMVWLSGLDNLCQLHLFETRVGDRGLEQISRLPRLWCLLLQKTHVTDAGMPHLAKLHKLQMLELDHTQITDAGAKHLAQLTELRSLSLSGTQITDASIPILQQLIKLKELHLNHTGMTPAGVERLQGLLPKAQIFSIRD